ncbi:alcohol dehydrogenase [Bradyrhizobium liaoningense]|uniref:alcohol dehydrogenase n=1 Tax=Bradyrhizobium liaoningense TaxID=43992 RepID=UPI002012D95F|nr:alcohol dehydrogenase [Bradyrhizobium liaoningense]
MKSLALTQYRGALECIETTTPTPTGSEVLLRVKACGVCHTDLHIWDGGYDMGSGKMMKMADRGQTLPHTMGHEIVGEVLAAGPDAEKFVEMSRTYLVYPWMGCGECSTCKAGDEHLCPTPQYLGVLRPGGYSDHVMIKHPRYLIDIPAIPAEQAAPYACSGLTAYSALKKLGAGRRNKPILIVGAGGLGLMCLSLLKALGGSGAIVADIDADKRDAAIVAGAMLALDPRDNDFAARTREAAKDGIHAIIDFVGSPASWDLSMAILAKGGTYVMVGLYGGERTLPLATMPLRAITLSGSFVGSRRELIELMGLLRTNKVDWMPIVKRPLETAYETLSDLKHGRIVGRAVLVPS